jgi:hypothetical protein
MTRAVGIPSRSAIAAHLAAIRAGGPAPVCQSRAEEVVRELLRAGSASECVLRPCLTDAFGRYFPTRVAQDDVIAAITEVDRTVGGRLSENFALAVG